MLLILYTLSVMFIVGDDRKIVGWYNPRTDGITWVNGGPMWKGGYNINILVSNVDLPEKNIHLRLYLCCNT